MHRPQPTQRPHVQENEAGTIANLQPQSWRPDSRIYTTEMPASAESETKYIRGQQQSSYTPDSTAAGRNWRKRPHSPCLLDFQCSGDREEEEAYLKHPALFSHTVDPLVDPCHILWIYDSATLGESDHLPQFFDGECHLQRASSSNNHHPFHSALWQSIQWVLRDVCFLSKEKKDRGIRGTGLHAKVE